MKDIFRRSVGSLLAVLMVFSLFSSQMLSVFAEDSCGYTPAMTMTELASGTEDAKNGESYSISSRDELTSFASYVNAGRPTEGATFYLTCDVKLDNDEVWTPIGSEAANAFHGTFDGCGFAVLNFDNSAAGDYYALFAYVSGSSALIKNLGVEGEVSGGSYVAGIVASLHDGAIENCWSAVDVSGSSVIGGVAATVSGASIQNSLSYGYIKGDSNVGAVAGTVSTSDIEYCYYVYYGADAAVGESTRSTVSVYRFASSSTEVLTETTLTVGTEKTDDLITLLNAWIEQKNALSDYREWTYDTSSGSTKRTDGRYPMLVYPGHVKTAESIYTATATMTALYESGSNAESGAFYSISSAQEFAYLRDYINAGYSSTGVTFFLTCDINMSTISTMSTDQQWIPIGSTEDTPFKGIFDGQGYFIADNLITSGDSCGLFGYVDDADAEIKNVAASGILTAKDNVGGIVGYLVSGNVINCWFDGEISADDRVGGIVGRVDSGNITNCVSFATVGGNNKVGGIVGATSSAANIKYCYYPLSSNNGCGDSSATQTAVVGYTKSGSDFTLERSVTVGSASGVKLLNVLNHWVTYLATDNSYLSWKIDSTAAGIARIQGEHPTQFFPGDSSGTKRVDEPQADVDSTKNPYSVIYTETATMTELYESGEVAVQGGHYSISSADELELLSNFVNNGNDTDGVTFYLTKNITIAINGLGNDSSGWQPIGKDFSGTDVSTLKYTFRGTFDGCGYTVSGMFITNEKGDNVGLFGRVRGGTIKNLGVVGGIVGEFNCGGIVGKIDDGVIEDCWAAVSIQSESETGGIAGKIDNTTIRNCVSYGGLLCYGGESCVAGGIFGDDNGSSTVTNCYYLQNTTTAGYNSVKKSSTVDIITFTYAFRNDDYFCTLERAATIDSVTTTSLLDALNAWVQLQNNGQYSGWYNSNVLISDGDGNNSGHYPRLMDPKTGADSENTEYEGDYTAISSVSALYSTRTDGIDGGCYSINSLDDLEALQKYVAEGFKTENIIFFMTRDIDMSLKYSNSTDRSWEPIGNSSAVFQGIFDGQGYTIKDLYINNSSDDQGLFGHTGKNATIKNLGICGIVRAGTNAGGIVGDMNFSTIANCWSSCEVTALDNNAGGLVGGANMGTIVNCTSYGVVVNGSQYGAIAGYAFGTTIKYCYYLYGTCQQAYGEASTPNASGVMYFNGTSAACILDEKVDVEGTSTRNALSALKLYVDAHPETNYCYWAVGNTEEYVKMGVALFPVLISASNTMGENDYRTVQAYYAGQEYNSLVKAINAANDAEGGGDVTLAVNAILSKNQDVTLDDDVRLLTGDYSLVIKSSVNVQSMQQLNGMFIVKEGGSISLPNDDGGYSYFIYSDKDADASCNSVIYGTDSLTFFSNEVGDGAESDAYNLTLQDGEFIVNSTLDSGNPHKIPAGSTISVEKRATFNVSSNARIRTTGGAEIYNNGGTMKIGNATLNPNGGSLMKGVFEDSNGTVTLPFIYKDGYTLKGWTVNEGDTPYKAGSTVDVQTATTLTANWSLGQTTDPYPGDDAYSDNDEPVYDIPINVIQSNGGSISPDSMKAAKGETLRFTVSADSGYYVKNVLVDKASVSLDSGSYTFVGISKEHTISALFAQTTNSEYYNWVNPFSDVKSNDWFYDNVRYCASANLFSGTGSDTFSPNMDMTREMFVTVLWRLSGSPIVPGDGCSFTDVSSSSYAYEAIRWGTYYGIVNGYSNTKFGYGVSVSREQLVTFMFRYAKNYAGDDVSLYDTTNILGYSDVVKISKGMTQAFQWAIGAGVVSGTTSTTLDPQGTASRAQVAAILSRYCNKFVNTVPVLNS